MAKITKPKQKPNKVGKILLASGSAALVAVGGVTVALKHEDIKSWFNHNKTYSYEELQAKLQENDDRWENKLANLLANSNELKTQISELTKAKATSDAKIAELESNISAEQTKYKALEAELEATNADHAKELEDLKSQHAKEIIALKTELESEKNNNNSLTDNIEDLNQKLADAEQKIQMYEQIIQQYENNETAPVSYYDGDDLILATLVSKGSTYSLDSAKNPVDTDTRQFVGYGIDGNLVDDKSNVISSATVYHAMFNYKITYIVNGVETSHFVFENATIDSNAPDTTPGQNQEFSHWEDGDGNTINLSEIKATKSMTVTAVFDEVYNITFNYDNKSETIRLVNGSFETAVPSPTTKTGYGLAGWIDSSGQKISTSNLKRLTADTVLTPEFIQLFEITIAYRVGSGSYSNYSTKIYTFLGSADTQYLHEEDLMSVIAEIENLTGKTASGKCASLVSSATPYLTLKSLTASQNPVMKYTGNTTIYITLN